MTVSRGREWRCSSMPHVASVAVNGDETAAGDTSLSSFWGLRQSQCRTTGINQAKEAYLSNYREFALYETHGRCITGTEIRTIQQSSQLVMPEWWIISNGGDSRCWEKGKSRGDEGPCTSNGSPTPPYYIVDPSPDADDSGLHPQQTSSSLAAASSHGLHGCFRRVRDLALWLYE